MRRNLFRVVRRPAPFPYFGGKRTIARDVWARLGTPKQYIEPFCGSAAMLLAAPSPVSLEVVCDSSGFIANFWRAVKHQPSEVARWADYPVSHIDLGSRHRWLMDHREGLDMLQDPDWPGDAKIAGWWLWGQCAWIGSGWCEWTGKIPHISDAGRGIQAVGQIPHISDAGRGELLTSAGRVAWEWLHRLADRLERVRVVHGDWSRCLNSHYGGADTAVFLDPPYRAYERLYGTEAPVADAVAQWASEHPEIRIALCGHVGDYTLPGWDAMQWSRGRATYSGSKTTALECVWYSPACLRPKRVGQEMLPGMAEGGGK
jgi:hypothetical protein